jgi:hypothetical protein
MTPDRKGENDLPGAQDQGGKQGGQKGGAGPTPQPDDEVWDEKKQRPERPDRIEKE